MIHKRCARLHCAFVAHFYLKNAKRTNEKRIPPCSTDTSYNRSITIENIMKKSTKAPRKSASASASKQKKNVEVEILAPAQESILLEKDTISEQNFDQESDTDVVVLEVLEDVLDHELDDLPDELDDELDAVDDLHHDDDAEPHGPVISPSSVARISSSRDNLHLYLKEVSRFPMLQPEEEQELAKRVRDHGDTDAAFRLVSSHLRLVVKIAMDFQRRWMQNVLDLIQEGNVGLMRAVNKFDPDKGIKFSYYAAFWVKAYILKYIMNNWRMVKIGTTQVQRKLFFNLNKERQKLISQGFDPDAAMLSEKLGVSIDQIQEMDQRLGASDMSLDMQVSDATGGASRMDFLPALDAGVEDSIASNEIAALIQMHLESIIPKLNEKENYILQNRLLTDEPVTLREIGERYNVTRERVRQLEARLLEKLRQHLSNDIKDFSEEWINT